MNQSWDNESWRERVLAAARKYRAVSSEQGVKQLLRAKDGLVAAILYGEFCFPGYDGAINAKLANHEALAEIERVGGARTIRPDEIVKMPFTESTGETLGTCAINVGEGNNGYHYAKLGSRMIYSTAYVPQATPANISPPSTSND